MENNSIKDIAVFTFARGSQLNSNIMESDSYRFVLKIINSMMNRNGVDTPKVGLGGTKEDVCCFIAGLIEYQLLYNVNIEYEIRDTYEYDIDTSSDVLNNDLG
jgi:hypothetical protein